MSKQIKIRVLATTEGGAYAGPFRDTTVGNVYRAELVEAGEDNGCGIGDYDSVEFKDDAGDYCAAYVPFHEGVSYEVVE